MSRAELLRPWADAPCPCLNDDVVTDGGWLTSDGCPKCVMAGNHVGACERCHGTGFDPRFDGLRGEHEWVEGEVTGNSCRLCGWSTYPEPPYCLRTDLGALARVAAACGSEVLEAVCQRIEDAYSHIGGLWTEEPEDAATAALVAALPELAA